MQKGVKNAFPLFYCLLLCSNLTLAVPLYSVGLPPKINFGFGLNILHLFFLPQFVGNDLRVVPYLNGRTHRSDPTVNCNLSSCSKCKYLRYLRIVVIFISPSSVTYGDSFSTREKPFHLRSQALRRLSSRFNGIGGLPRGDKGRIETSLVPPWKIIEKKLSHLIKPLTPT